MRVYDDEGEKFCRVFMVSSEAFYLFWGELDLSREWWVGRCLWMGLGGGNWGGSVRVVDASKGVLLASFKGFYDVSIGGCGEFLSALATVSGRFRKFLEGENGMW